MPKVDTPLQKHTLNFHEGDLDKLRRYYPDIEVSTLVRELVHNFVLNYEAQQVEPSTIKVDGVELRLPGLKP